jgi:hypothetical protein
MKLMNYLVLKTGLKSILYLKIGRLKKAVSTMEENNKVVIVGHGRGFGKNVKILAHIHKIFSVVENPVVLCNNYLQGGCECENKCKAQAKSGLGIDLINQVLQLASKPKIFGELLELAPTSKPTSRGGKRFLKEGYHECRFDNVRKK